MSTSVDVSQSRECLQSASVSKVTYPGSLSVRYALQSVCLPVHMIDVLLIPSSRLTVGEGGWRIRAPQPLVVKEWGTVGSYQGHSRGGNHLWRAALGGLC